MVTRVGLSSLRMRGFLLGHREYHAPISIKASGISCVIAKSFARIFYRNAINTGLPILISPAAVDGIEKGDLVQVDPMAGIIRNVTRGTEFKAGAFSDKLQEIIKVGGLINYAKDRLQSR